MKIEQSGSDAYSETVQQQLQASERLQAAEKNKKTDGTTEKNRSQAISLAESSEQPLDKEEMKSMLEQVNQYADLREVNLRLKMDDDTETMVIKVIDKETDEVIRQIPSEHAIKLAKDIQDAMEDFLSPDQPDNEFHFLSDEV